MKNFYFFSKNFINKEIIEKCVLDHSLLLSNLHNYNPKIIDIFKKHDIKLEMEIYDSNSYNSSTKKNSF